MIGSRKTEAKPPGVVTGPKPSSTVSGNCCRPPAPTRRFSKDEEILKVLSSARESTCGQFLDLQSKIRQIQVPKEIR
jgi:hypothetical protein